LQLVEVLLVRPVGPREALLLMVGDYYSHHQDLVRTTEDRLLCFLVEFLSPMKVDAFSRDDDALHQEHD
jgi:hypothetical protein